MGLLDKRLAAAFYLPGYEQRPAERLLELAGATDVGAPASDPSGFIDCRWAGMQCVAVADERTTQRLLAIFFFQSSFYEQQHEGDEQPAQPVADAFAQACEALQPDAAVVVTHLHQADIDELWRIGALVLEADSRRLAAQRPGLLYVSSELEAYEGDAWYRQDRDVVETPSGRLVFSGRGAKRWS
jgi:hypothetical protein